MPPSRSKDRKVSVSFTNWVLGGSLVSLTSTDSETGHRRVSGRKVIINEVDSNDDEIVVKHVEKPEIEKKGKKKEGEGGEKKDDKKDDKKDEKKDEEKDQEKKKKDGASTEKEKKMCKSCGKEKDGGDVDKAKKDDGEKGKKDDGDKSKKDGGEKKSDSSKDKSDKSGNNGGGGGNGWTDEQISKLKEMKAAEKSWKDIAAEMKTTPGDCKAKWKELQASGNTKLDFGDSNNEKNKGNDKSGDADVAGDNNGWVTGEDADAVLDFSGLFGDEPTKEPENSNSPKNSGNSGNDGGNPQNGKNNGNGGGWGSSQNQDQNTGSGCWHKPDNDQNNGSGWKQKDDTNTGGSGWNSNLVQSPPQRYHASATRRLRPDEQWSKEDCEVLEMLMYRYKEHKWLNMKAGFFNWTGRMVSDEMLQKKFHDDGWI